MQVLALEHSYEALVLEQRMVVPAVERQECLEKVQAGLGQEVCLLRTSSLCASLLKQLR